VVLLLSGGLLGSVLAPAAFATPPPTPSPLPAGIEQLQPYVGQSICDPVAKPGVKAFSSIVLNAYRDTSSLGIVRDCGTGGQSEHKEGRAWDWGVSVSSATDVAHVNEMMAWLMATDAAGNKYARLRRLGIMYMIWNKRIWKAYQPDKGWQAYSGADPHTGHVHFSFGWAGAKKVTSFWDGTDAPIDYGPNGVPPLPVVTPVATPANLPVLASYGASTLTPGATGAAVSALQKGLQRTVTGTWSSDTSNAVAAFQQQQARPVDGNWDPSDWLALFPKPTLPFGALEHVDPALGQTVVSGWAIDAGDDVPLEVHAYVDGAFAGKPVEDLARPDIAQTYTQYTAAHGFRLPLTLTDGQHQVCAYALNAPGTTGANSKLGCLTTTVQHAPVGGYESLAQTPSGLLATGWALDPDSDDPLTLHVYVDDVRVGVTPLADADRPELADRFPAYSTRHGFAAALDLADGPHKVCVFALNAAATPGGNTLLGCRWLTVRHSAVGVLDPVVTPPGTVTVSGAALDPDTAASVDAKVYVDGVLKTSVPATQTRQALATYAAWGDQRGFTASLTLSAGTHQVCAYAANASGTPGGNGLLGCQSVVVRHDPTGSQERVAQDPTGTVVTGWALDPDTTASQSVHVYVDGTKATEVVADLARPDVAARFPGQSSAHGFRAVLDLPAGTHQVCTWALNAAGTPGTNTQLPCASVVVRHAPVGTAPVLGRRGSAVTLSGWALDPDSAGAIGTHVYVDGKKAAETPANVVRAGIPTTYAAYGTAHGYATSLQLTEGKHTVCVWALNAAATPGGNTLLGCAATVVRHSPFGNLSTTYVRSDGVVVGGWAIDPDTTGGVTVRLTSNGRQVAVVGAVLYSSSLGRAYPTYGPKHAFQTLLHLPRGTQRLCARADNGTGTPGTARSLGCRYVTVP
jgi:hypothetical protein